MSLEENKAVVRRYYEEVGNQRQFAVADEIFAPGFKMFPDSNPPYGPENVKQFMAWFTGVFPDLQAKMDEIICEGEIVAVRVTLHATQTNPVDWINGFGVIAPTGKPFDLREYQFWRVTDGKIVERWVCFDTLAMLYDLGVVGANP
jgi:predicted ester cyclase